MTGTGEVAARAQSRRNLWVAAGIVAWVASLLPAGWVSARVMADLDYDAPTWLAVIVLGAPVVYFGLGLWWLVRMMRRP